MTTDITNLFSLAGKTALVTGAPGGLGQYFATVLASAGASVVVAARREDKLEKLAGEISGNGQSAHAVAMDVTSTESVNNAFDQAGSVVGDIHILVNNAGTAYSAPFLEADELGGEGTRDTNLKGAWIVAKAFSQRLADKPVAGSLINIASILGLRVKSGVASYCASKAGLIQLTKAMALELAPYGIRVNAIAPGYVETDINREFLASPAGQKMIKRIPQQRTGRFEDLRGPLLLLASSASEYMTGSVITVDGGHLCSTI